MLAARRTSGTELSAHRQAHLGRPARHERELGRLVQQLVETDSDEVEVHDLHHGPHAGHGGSHAQTYDGRFRNRGVADTLTEAVSQSPGESEHVAPGTDVDRVFL